jgi:2-polyprenyl-6-methoxyphenol hydroxylase-like FAD-dependent oxidoreductase
MERRFQVVIVGGGPVGVALAIELGRRNITCALVERHLTPQRIPKGQNLTNRTMEHFYFWGIADELRAARLLPPGYPIGGITAYGNLMSEYWYATFGGGGRGESVRDYYFQANERLPQYRTEEVLRRRLAQCPTVTALFGWAATAITQNETGVQVTIAAEADRRHTQTLTADYLVACDGAHSTVRAQAGIARGGIDFGQRMVLAVFRSRQLHAGLSRFPPLHHLPRVAPRPQGLLAVLRPGGCGRGVVLPRPRPSRRADPPGGARPPAAGGRLPVRL